jgi:hypothetical protein
MPFNISGFIIFILAFVKKKYFTLFPGSEGVATLIYN